MFLIGVAAPAASPAQAQETITLNLHHFLAPSSTTQKRFLEPWARDVAERSKGKLQIRIFPLMQLGGRAPQLYNQARDGVADIVWTLPGYTPGRFPITEVFELPFYVTTAEATSQAIEAFSQHHLKEEYADTHPLLFHVHSRGSFHMRKKDVQSLDDLKGLKIRGPSRTATTMLEFLGATPVGMPVPDVPASLSRGVIDGALLPWQVTTSLRTSEIATSHTEFGGEHGLYTAVFLLTMNKDTYNNLPRNLQKVLDDTTGIARARAAGKVYDEDELPGRAIA
ncbi:MAG: TRAP transporter substrate-binding protein, partial [Actinomycetia bacterium]|nr:TRAP transporter substrate-binding protein [Actinomycetes bacterium]